MEDDKNTQDNLDDFIQESFRNQEEKQLKEKWAALVEDKYGIRKTKPFFLNLKKMVYLFLALLGLGLFIKYALPKDKAKISIEVNKQIAQLDVLSNAQYEQRGIHTTTDEISLKAFQALQKKQYKTAIYYYSALQETQRISTQDQYYHSFAYCKLGDFKSAIRILEGIIMYNDTHLEESRWLLSLCYISDKDYPKAKENLKSIVDNNAFKAKSAKELFQLIQVNKIN